MALAHAAGVSYTPAINFYLHLQEHFYEVLSTYAAREFVQEYNHNI